MTRFPRDDYRQLLRYEPDRRPVDVDLSDNTNLWGPHPEAMSALATPTADLVRRYPSVYADPLREAVADKLGVSAECVTTGCGSDDILDSTLRAAALPGARVAFPVPTFSMIETLARVNGMQPRPVVSVGELPAPAVLLDDDPAVIYLCRPNNPTGLCTSRDSVQALLNAGGEGGPIVLLDEAYADFADDSFVLDAPDSHRLLVLRTMSKAYGLAGLRVGFAVGPRGVVEEIEKSRGPYKVPTVSEAAAVAALRGGDEWRRYVVGEVRTARIRLTEELRNRGFEPIPSSANFVLLPVGGRDPSLTASRATGALRAQGVAVRPFPGVPEIGDAIRITLGPTRHMDRFLEAWDEITSSMTSLPEMIGPSEDPA